MTIYLDNSFLNRPFDNPEVGINKLEAEALHLASAEQSQVDFFITCDYNRLRLHHSLLVT